MSGHSRNSGGIVTGTGPPKVRIETLFREQARQAPDVLAVVSVDCALNYGELDRASDHVAARVQSEGVGPDDLVGIYLDKTVEMVIALLGVLKAGGAYVPISPSDGLSRVADAPLRLVLTEITYMPKIGRLPCPVVLVDDCTPGSDVAPPHIRHGGSDADLAYVIYTSGSSGTPKGVAVEHRSLAHSVRAREAQYPVPQAFLLLSAVAFDSAVAGIFGTLLRGGTLHLPPPGTEADVRAVARLIRREAIDTILALPSLYELLLDTVSSADQVGRGANDALGPEALASLVTVIVAGERCPPRLLSRTGAVAPQVQLHNEYGPTEATVWCSVWTCPDPVPPDLPTVPIGHAISGVVLEVVDVDGRPCPPGEAGELCVAGPTLARGYLGRPDLTALQFESVPERGPGARRYRTGDLVRLMADGEYEFLGRLDRQVKIQGFRVEPGEIEDALTRHPDITQVAVVTDLRSADTALVAFIVGTAEPPRLREFALDQLPGYMVPGDFVVVDALPLTTNGKVDAAALQERLHAAGVTSGNGMAEDAAERLVADVWCEVLGVAQVSRDHSFFEYGSSLDAVRVALRLSEVLGAEFPMLWVYEHPTVAMVAGWLSSDYASSTALRGPEGEIRHAR